MSKLLVSVSVALIVLTMAFVLPAERIDSEPVALISPPTKVRAGLPPTTKAKFWVERGEQYWKERGKDAAVAEFQKTDGRFTRSDLILFAFDQNGTMLSTGENAGPDLRDAVAGIFQKDLLPLARTNGEGQIQIAYKNPGSDKVERKTLYARKIGDVILCAVAS